MVFSFFNNIKIHKYKLNSINIRKIWKNMSEKEYMWNSIGKHWEEMESFSENLNYMGYKKQNMNLQILDVEILK